jgi:hypothetical protein
MNRTLPSRRQVLACLAIGAATTLAATGAALVTREVTAHRSAEQFAAQLLALLPDTRAAARIGAIWAHRHPQFFASTEILPRRLAARLGAVGPWAIPAPEIGSRVAAIIRDDFQRGRIEDIAGWRLSAFQADLCGLAYLIRSQPNSA